MRSIRNSLQRGSPVSGESIGLLMVKTIRDISAVNNRVGPDVMEIILPNRQVPVLQSVPNSFAYFQGGSGERVTYMPALVKDQMKMTGDRWLDPPR